MASHLCDEGDWAGLDAGPIFRAVKQRDCCELAELLEDPSNRRKLDDTDGDDVGALHILALNDPSYQDAIEIVEAFKNAGADLNIRSNRDETPLAMAACYGSYGVIRALVESGALIHTADSAGRTPLTRAEKFIEKGWADKEEDGKKCLEFLQDAAQKEMESSTRARQGDNFRLKGNLCYEKEEFEQAIAMYTKSLELWADHRTYGNRSAAYLKSAWDRIFSGVPGHRQFFKLAFMDAEKAVGIDPKYEKGWYRKAKGYLGFRDLPRAKEAAKTGLDHCPDSAHLQEIWDALDKLGVPDYTSNHLSDEWQAVFRKVYIERWIGEEACFWCGLSCMDNPKPDKCPFCMCDTSKKLTAEENDIITELTEF